MTLARLTYGFARENGILLLDDEVEARVGLRPGFDPLALIEVRRALGRAFEVMEMGAEEFDQQLSNLYTVSDLNAESFEEERGGDDLSHLLNDIPQTADLLAGDDDAPVIRLINALMARALQAKASDIHIEPYEHQLSVRLRIDGVLQDILKLNAKVSPLLISRIKVMARLDIAEKRIPQDGRMSLSLGERVVDVRVSTLPSRYGERVVLRLLEKDRGHVGISDLGMDGDMARSFKAALQQPNGIILVTGPTGSGKTTTLYAGLGLLNDASRNILTIEDPVEYAIDGIGQTQVNAKVGMTFSAGLRAILRQDPDVVMVGEIRDKETVDIAVQASLTGHLVLSTLHTNSAVAAITRLRDMGVEPFLLSSSLKGLLAQRLVRRLCSHCKVQRPLSMEEQKLFSDKVTAPEVVYSAQGCEDCHHTGYQGRVGIYEFVPVDSAMAALIHANSTEAEISAHAFANGLTLMEAGLSQVSHGITSLDEVLRVCRVDGGRS